MNIQRLLPLALIAGARSIALRPFDAASHGPAPLEQTNPVLADAEPDAQPDEALPATANSEDMRHLLADRYCGQLITIQTAEANQTWFVADALVDLLRLNASPTQT
jgi:hypothetical protein